VAGFLDAVTERVDASLAELPDGDAAHARLIFTAHSIPVVLAETSEYESQLRTAAAGVAERVGIPHDLVFQSRSGPPQVPWLEPDIVDHLAGFDPATVAVVVPLGFVSDHMEVLFDLDTQAAATAADRGITMHRVPTVGTLPTFVRGLAASLAARFRGEAPVTIDGDGGRPFPCAADCCPPPPPRPRPGA
jgi:ferrochelatase